MPEPTKAPDITLKAIETGREIRLNAGGPALVLVFASQANTEHVNPFRAALRARFPDPSAVVIASVIDVHSVPRLMRKMAETALAGRFKAVVAQLAPGQSPRDYVVMLPDWKGTVASSMGLGELGGALAIAVIDRRGVVAGTYQGEEPLQAVITLLAAAAA